MLKFGEVVIYIGNAYPELKNKECMIVQVDERENSYPYRITRGTGCYWVCPENIKETSKFTITADSLDYKGSHKKLAEKLEEYNKLKEERKNWTPEELEIAQRLYEQYLAEFVDTKNFTCRFKVYEDEKKVILTDNNDSYSIILGHWILARAVAKGDPFNPLIGKVVCLCKVLKKPIPDFIKRKNAK